MNKKKLFSLALFLVVIYAALLASGEGARSWANHNNLLTRIGMYGIISLGAGTLIIAGGIDLSIGSVMALCATVFALLLTKWEWHPALAILATVGLGAVIGSINGILVTKLRAQAFVVTLCGLFIYRGAARWIADDSSKGLGAGFKEWKQWLYRHDDLPVSMSILIFLALVALFGVFWHYSVAGRYLFAIGSNEQAARYSGIRVDRYKILAYTICSALAGFYAVLFLMEIGSVQPSSSGNFLELYAIAGAVLGGCSLRGGEGNIFGVLIGATILVLLPNLSQMWYVPSTLEQTVIGSALLIGSLIDAADWRHFGWLRRLLSRKKAAPPTAD